MNLLRMAPCRRHVLVAFLALLPALPRAMPALDAAVATATGPKAFLQRHQEADQALRANICPTAETLARLDALEKAYPEEFIQRSGSTTHGRMLFVSAGQCLERNGADKEALHLYEKFLERTRDWSQHTGNEVRLRIARMHAEGRGMAANPHAALGHLVMVLVHAEGPAQPAALEAVALIDRIGGMAFSPHNKLRSVLLQQGGVPGLLQHAREMDARNSAGQAHVRRAYEAVGTASPEAALRLGILYRDGIGGPVHLPLALHFLQAAGEAGKPHITTLLEKAPYVLKTPPEEAHAPEEAGPQVPAPGPAEVRP